MNTKILVLWMILLMGNGYAQATDPGIIYPEDAGILPHAFFTRIVHHLYVVITHFLRWDRDIPVTEDVKFFLVTRENLGFVRDQLVLDSLWSMWTSNFKSDRHTIFIIHGWTDDSEHEVFQYLQIEMLKAIDVNIIMVDWARLSGLLYSDAVDSIQIVARQTAEFIKFLANYNYIMIENLHVIGHSLGAQTSGLIGAYFHGNISRITGLDPAGPLFEFPSKKNPDQCLDRTDAQFVNVIHTSNRFFGVEGTIGHVDFYPNNGNVPQPGCYHLLSTVSCSHVRAVQYLTESINTKVGFWGRKCVFDQEDGVCWKKSRTRSLMGFWTSKKDRGSFYLETRPKAPFAKGDLIF